MQTVNRFGLDLVAQDKQGATRLYLATDGLGSVRVETQGANAVAAKLYNPFGAVLEQYGTSQTSYGYTGEQFNATSGLLYLRARYYNPNLRLFTAKYPFAGSPTAPASMHGYSYAHNNPVLYTDPTGKYIESPIDAAFIGFDILSLGYNLYYGYTAQTHADRVYYSNQASIDVVALAIDFGMLGTPGATGGGMVYRFAMAGGKTIDIVIDCSKLAKVAQQGSVKLAQVLPHILTAQSGSGNGGGSSSSNSSGDPLEIDPQTGKRNPKSIEEAQSIRQAEAEGLIQNPRRPNLSLSQYNIDFIIDGGDVDIKTPRPPSVRSFTKQIREIAESINVYQSDTMIIVDLRFLNPADKITFVEGLNKSITRNLENVRFLNQ